jgi:hypothetical protein
MTLDEISYWLKRLIEEESLGWSKDLKLLAQILGLSFTFAIKNRAYGKVRMSAPEQKRVAEALKDVIEGKIICVRRLRCGQIRGELVLESDPRPISERAGPKGFVQVTRKGVKLTLRPQKFEAPVSKMPSFGELLGKTP